MADKIFCKNCERRLKQGNIIFKGEQIVEFKDGFYCRKCADVKLEKSRTKDNDTKN